MKLFVWDFHGTLEKGTEKATYEISNRILENYAYKERFTEKVCSSLYGRKWYQYFEYLLPYENNDRHMFLQSAALELADTEIDIIKKNLQPNDHAHTVLETVGKKHDQIVISNTTQPSLETFIRLVDMNRHFPPDRVHGVGAHTDTTKTKLELLRQYLEDKNYHEIVIIGDSESDMELATVAGDTTYLYAHPGNPFRKVKSTYKIRDLRKVLREL